MHRRDLLTGCGSVWLGQRWSPGHVARRAQVRFSVHQLDRPRGGAQGWWPGPRTYLGADYFTTVFEELTGRSNRNTEYEGAIGGEPSAGMDRQPAKTYARMRALAGAERAPLKVTWATGHPDRYRE